MKTLMFMGIVTIVALAITIAFVQYGSRIRVPHWMNRRQPIRVQLMPLHNTTAKIQVVDEGVRFLPAPPPRTDGTIYDQLVAEFGFDPLASKVSPYNFPLAS